MRCAGKFFLLLFYIGYIEDVIHVYGICVQISQQQSIVILLKMISRYLSFCEKMLLLVKNYDITPIMVVDGENLKAKEKEDERRRE